MSITNSGAKQHIRSWRNAVWHHAHGSASLLVMISTLAIILSFQLIGEVVSRAMSLPLPGPVVGLVLLLLACILRPSLATRIRGTTLGLLQHLSLFFVPAGVGIVAHGDLLREHGTGLALALMGSTVMAIAVGAWVFAAVARWTGSTDPEAQKDQDDA